MAPEEAIARAVERAELDDFGPDGWREGLDRCLDAFERVALKPEVRAAAYAKIVDDLATRLRIEEWRRVHPETQAYPVEGPVFVVGLPRTGTTATVAMMALDERFRFMRPWEGTAPLPPPVAGEEDSDPRVIAAREAAKTYDKHNIHLFDADGPEEDLAFLAGLDMHSYHGAYPMPDDYIDWWLHKDFTSFYAYHERILKLLHSRRPPRLWLLKSPPHLFRMREIARQYPKATFVVTHRDPVKVIGSVASLHSMLHEERCEPGSVDREAVGRRQLALWSEGMRRFLAARSEIGEHRFVDVRNDDVVARPLETFERVYDHLAMPFTPQLRRRLEEYNSRNAPGNFGRHRYTPEEYGLTEAAIREIFRDYVERFDL